MTETDLTKQSNSEDSIVSEESIFPFTRDDVVNTFNLQSLPPSVTSGQSGNPSPNGSTMYTPMTNFTEFSASMFGNNPFGNKEDKQNK